MKATPTDAQTWALFKQGDNASFRAIYDQHASYLFNYGRKLIRDDSLIQDTLHDMFVDLWQKRETIGQTDAIRKYLTVVFRRRLIAQFKKSQQTTLPSEIEESAFDAELDVEALLIQGEISQEKIQKLEQAMATLSPRQREILYLKFFQSLEYEQIAEVLDIKYQSLRNLVSQAILKLRDAMTTMLWPILSQFAI